MKESTMPTEKMKEQGNPSPWVLVDEFIWYLGRPVIGFVENRKPGYYFEDETADVNGPYPTLEEAKLALKRYCETELQAEGAH